MHIATSVVNRILNAHASISAQAQSAERGAPSVPDSGPLGDALESSIAEPTGPVGPTDPTMAEDVTTQVLFQ
jgi:hypothetical protein